MNPTASPPSSAEAKLAFISLGFIGMKLIFLMINFRPDHPNLSAGPKSIIGDWELLIFPRRLRARLAGLTSANWSKIDGVLTSSDDTYPEGSQVEPVKDFVQTSIDSDQSY
jgi:hypothetical protein